MKKLNEEFMFFFYFFELLDIINIFDFIEGLDMIFDLGVELCVVMEGLDNLDENDFDDVVV